MDELKNKIEELKARIAELRAIGAEKATAQEARELRDARKKLERAEADLTVLSEAFAEDEGGDDEAETEAPVEAPAEVEVPAEAPAEAEAAEDVVLEAPVAIAASAGDLAGASASDSKPLFGITASATMGDARTGQALESREQVMSLLNQTNMRNKSKGENKTRILEIQRFADDAPRVSSSNSPAENSRIIRRVTEKFIADNQETLHQALTAAACFCGPDEIDDSIAAIGTTARPVAGIFPTVPANGGFEFLRDLTIDPNSGSTAQWTCDDQDAVDPDDPDTWKVCSELDCFTTELCYPYMVTACTIVGRQHQWAHPEQIDAWINKILIEYARLAEQLLLDVIDDNAVNQLEVGLAEMAEFGLRPQIDYALGSLAYPMGIQFREADSSLEGMVMLVPRGMIDAVLTDEFLRGFPSDIRTRADLLAHWRSAYGVRVVERLEERTGALTTAAIATVTALNAGGNIDAVGTPLQPPQYRIYLIDPTQFVHMEGTLVAADWHTDVALLRQNKNLYFLENIEQLCFTGYKKVYAIDVNGCIKGTVSDLVEAPSC